MMFIVPKGRLTKYSSIVVVLGAIGTPVAVWFAPFLFEWSQLFLFLGIAGIGWGIRRALP